MNTFGDTFISGDKREVEREPASVGCTLSHFILKTTIVTNTLSHTQTRVVLRKNPSNGAK